LTSPPCILLPPCRTIIAFGVHDRNAEALPFARRASGIFFFSRPTLVEKWFLDCRVQLCSIADAFKLAYLPASYRTQPLCREVRYKRRQAACSAESMRMPMRIRCCTCLGVLHLLLIGIASAGLPLISTTMRYATVRQESLVLGRRSRGSGWSVVEVTTMQRDTGDTSQGEQRGHTS